MILLYWYLFYYLFTLNIMMQLLGITLTILNNEICYICVLKQSLFIPVYYYLAMLTVFNKNAFTAHTASHSTKTHILALMFQVIRYVSKQSYIIMFKWNLKKISILLTLHFVLISKHKVFFVYLNIAHYQFIRSLELFSYRMYWFRE